MAYQTRNLVFSPFLALKNVFSAKNGVKNQNFKNSKKVPLDILEIHVVSKFGPIRIKIAAGSLSEPHTHIHTYGQTDFSVSWYTIIPTYSYSYTAYLPLPRTQLSCTNFTTSPLTNVLLPSASRRKVVCQTGVTNNLCRPITI